MHNTTFSRFVPTKHNDLRHLQLKFNLPSVPIDVIRETPQSSNKPPSLHGVSRIDSGIPNSKNLRLDLADGLGVYDDELNSYINNRYDFLIKYCGCLRDFINILKPPNDSNSIPSTSFQTEENKISKHKDDYSKIQERHVAYSVVVSNVRLQQSHLVKLQELFTKLFTKPKQFSNEVNHIVFKTYFENEVDFKEIKDTVEKYNNEVSIKHLDFTTHLLKGETYKDLQQLLEGDSNTFKELISNFINILGSFVGCINDVKIKTDLETKLLPFYRLKSEQFGGRRKPTTKKSKKSNHADMNMKDIRRLCKANQIKLSTTKDGVRIIYKKKELITKLKRKKIL